MIKVMKNEGSFLFNKLSFSFVAFLFILWYSYSFITYLIFQFLLTHLPSFPIISCPAWCFWLVMFSDPTVIFGILVYLSTTIICYSCLHLAAKVPMTVIMITTKAGVLLFLPGELEPDSLIPSRVTVYDHFSCHIPSILLSFIIFSFSS